MLMLLRLADMILSALICMLMVLWYCFEMMMVLWYCENHHLIWSYQIWFSSVEPCSWNHALSSLCKTNKTNQIDCNEVEMRTVWEHLKLMCLVRTKSVSIFHQVLSIFFCFFFFLFKQSYKLFQNRIFILFRIYNVKISSVKIKITCLLIFDRETSNV